MKVHDMSCATDHGHAWIQTEQRGGTNETCDPHQKNAGGMTNQALAELSEGQSLAVGDRVRMSSRGRARHPKYGDREGFIVSKGSPSSWPSNSTNVNQSRASIATILRKWIAQIIRGKRIVGLEISIKRDRNRTERPVDLYSAPRASEVCSVCPLVGFSDRM